jgi:hypothetical protein
LPRSKEDTTERVEDGIIDEINTPPLVVRADDRVPFKPIYYGVRK